MITQTGSTDDFFKEVEGIMSRYIPHRRQYKTQRSAFDELRTTLPPGHVLLVVDFQERLSVKAQDEVQSQHWDNECTTIFPAVVYLVWEGRVWAYSFQVLSDDMAQDNPWVQHVMSNMLDNHIPSLLRKIGAPPMTHATLFTDNCSGKGVRGGFFKNVVLKTGPECVRIY